MSSSMFLSLLLSLQLLWVTMGDNGGGHLLTPSLTTKDPTTSPTFTPAVQPTTSTRTSPRDQTKNGMDLITPLNKKNCAWWCQDSYGMIVAAGLGGLFLISVILFVSSCCLWRRTKSQAALCRMKDMEMQSLTHRTAEDRSGMPTSDGLKTEPLVNNDEKVCNEEDCVSGSPPDTQEKTREAPVDDITPPNNEVDPPTEAAERL